MATTLRHAPANCPLREDHWCKYLVPDRPPSPPGKKRPRPHTQKAVLSIRVLTRSRLALAAPQPTEHVIRPRAQREAGWFVAHSLASSFFFLLMLWLCPLGNSALHGSSVSCELCLFHGLSSHLEPFSLDTLRQLVFALFYLTFAPASDSVSQGRISFGISAPRFKGSFACHFARASVDPLLVPRFCVPGNPSSVCPLLIYKIRTPFSHFLLLFLRFWMFSQ